MATTGVDRIFVDTNVLVYANVAAAPWHSIALQTLRQLQTAGAELWLSRQVIREYLATLTRPQTFSQAQAAKILETQVVYFQTHMRVAEDGPAVTAKLLELLDSLSIGGRQVHDANIVATMHVYGITQLLTHNQQDFSRYVPTIAVVPLVP